MRSIFFSICAIIIFTSAGIITAQFEKRPGKAQNYAKKIDRPKQQIRQQKYFLNRRDNSGDSRRIITNDKIISGLDSQKIVIENLTQELLEVGCNSKIIGIIPPGGGLSCTPGDSILFLSAISLKLKNSAGTVRRKKINCSGSKFYKWEIR